MNSSNFKTKIGKTQTLEITKILLAQKNVFLAKKGYYTLPVIL